MAKNQVKKEVVKEKTKKEKTKEVTSINSKLIIVACLILVLLLGIYFYRWSSVKNKEKYIDSYLISSGTINLNIHNLNEVNQVLFSSETPEKYFVLISYTEDNNTYKLEKSLKKLIDDYKLNDSFYYLNVKDIMKNTTFLSDLNKTFKTDKITTIPTILYFENDELVDVVKRVDDNMINAGDFQKLLDIYEY